MPLLLQAKLLRVLEDRSVRPLGADQGASINVRVIAASNKDLAAAVKDNLFREDLFYRLQVVPVIIPPLRERRSDIPLLIEYFLARMKQRFPCREISIGPEVMVHLWSYDWPGNVRELENLVERLVILCEGGQIDTGLLPPAMMAGRGSAAFAERLAEGAVDLNALVSEFEGRYINEALSRTGGNKQAAARLLGLKRTTFAAKLRRTAVCNPPPNYQPRTPRQPR